MVFKINYDSTKKDWKLLYLAAVGERDKRRLGRRISEAEHAIFIRQREVFYAGATLEEKEALEDALYALRALDSAREHTDLA
ncbi:MAG TPA: hypothetical protein VMT53_23655 [Terriglobales bacterium]|nr:hypothetical protein [Terriglobales bacterium]